MKLYKYKSLANLWHVLDLVLNQRLYCAHWSTLNDPLEGRYEIYLGNRSHRYESIMASRIEQARDGYRIASLSATPTNFLLWSHYAEGHKGVAIEVDIPDDDPDLTKVVYSPFSSVFSEKEQTRDDMRHLFNGKGEEWAYEEEYRIITDSEHFDLPSKPSRLLLGPMVPLEQAALLRKALSDHIEIVTMDLDRVQGTLVVVGPTPSLQPSGQPLQAVHG
ncbi:hypothetical protein PCO31110_02913 [Pandoraea communis]|uniref:DUF2971 domain-containing protein n=1 Tax=Pandoraea communis TaxID=2508297 RepID=A0A5E4VWH5_9BURK|nr:DUF2971 domain-containing protein [Pandoraea communis]VVE15866.1 hypothetical protein PCO31110_02913 [Pandoraea communis]